MSLIIQSEAQALAKVEALCAQNLSSYDIVIVERQRQQEWKYIATFAVITKNSTFSDSFVTAAFQFCVDSDGLFDFAGTKRELADLDFEALFLEAEITPGA